MYLLQAILTQEEKKIVEVLFQSKSIEQTSQKTGVKQHKVMAILAGIRIKLGFTDYDFPMFINKLFRLALEQEYQITS